MKKLLKSEAKEQISEFFFDIRNKSPKEIKKIKRLAMKNNIPLKELRKNFCKKCFEPLCEYTQETINHSLQETKTKEDE